MTIQIRPPRQSDASLLIDLFKKLDTQTSFMLFEPDERVISVEQQTQRISEFENAERRQMLVAKSAQQMVGVVVGNGGNANRNRHTLVIAIGVDLEFCGRGIGFRLMNALEAWAKDLHFHRLELTVMRHNERAIRLYEKCGYRQEGIKRHSLKVNGDFVDELQMAKLI